MLLVCARLCTESRRILTHERGRRSTVGCACAWELKINIWISTLNICICLANWLWSVLVSALRCLRWRILGRAKVYYRRQVHVCGCACVVFRAFKQVIQWIGFDNHTKHEFISKMAEPRTNFTLKYIYEIVKFQKNEN